MAPAPRNPAEITFIVITIRHYARSRSKRVGGHTLACLFRGSSYNHLCICDTFSFSFWNVILDIPDSITREILLQK